MSSQRGQCVQRSCGGRDGFEDMEGVCCSCSVDRECKKHKVWAESLTKSVSRERS